MLLATQHDHTLGPGEGVEIAVSYVTGGAATNIRKNAPNWTASKCQDIR